MRDDRDSKLLLCIPFRSPESYDVALLVTINTTSQQIVQVRGSTFNTITGPSRRFNLSFPVATFQGLNTNKLSSAPTSTERSTIDDFFSTICAISSLVSCLSCRVVNHLRSPITLRRVSGKLYSTMAPRFQACPLVGSPLYPNSIVWSEENLIAVASGHIVTILNPATPFGARGLIKIPDSKPFPVGVIEKKDLYSPGMLKICLSRDMERPCVRSLSWSPHGLSSNGGCLLAVCAADGRVKLYRQPYLEFQAEWVEVMDVSDMIYDYLVEVSFGESKSRSSRLSEGLEANILNKHSWAEDLPLAAVLKLCKKARDAKASRRSRRGPALHTERSNAAFTETGVFPCPAVKEGPTVDVVENKARKRKQNKLPDDVPEPKFTVKPLKNVPENGQLAKITAEQYASRIAMLSSVAISWSPVMHLLSENDPNAQKKSSNCFSLLAVGGKSGEISFSRIYEPRCYSVEQSSVPIRAAFAGLLQAHKAWVTAISWSMLAVDELHSQVLLVTGSSNGSVKIWIGNNEKLLKLCEDDQSPFVLLKEVIEIDLISVSVLSVSVPSKSLHKMHLAVGKVSGSIEVWICDLSMRKFDKVGSYDAHHRLVSGLAWAFDGCCLYSCSQDNSLRSWVLSETSLREVPIPSNTLGLDSSSNVPNVTDSCFGVAVSFGNMVLAVVRSFDTDLLDPMYQQRTLKGAVEFLWIGGQQLNNSLNINVEYDIEAFPGLSEELHCWESNIIWSLKQYQNLEKPLIVWDITTALSAFQKTASKFVERILEKWLSFTQIDPSSAEISSYASTATRNLHLLNILCRRVVLLDLNSEEINSKQKDLKELDELDQRNVWMRLLSKSENELRKRLVGFSLSMVWSISSDSVNVNSKYKNWRPCGLAQMEQWVVSLDGNHRDQSQLKLIAAKLAEIESSRLHEICNYTKEEKCNYCPQSVPFECPDVAFCKGEKGSNGLVQASHKLQRCAVSMQVCPTTPLWYCVCCQRRASKLPPHTIFQYSECPSTFNFSTNLSTRSAKPLCPFCGVLQQRLQPVFLLSPSPV